MNAHPKKFKVGDVVECVKSRHSLPTYITIGGQYTIQDYDRFDNGEGEWLVWVTENKISSYFESRFSLITSPTEGTAVDRILTEEPPCYCDALPPGIHDPDCAWQKWNQKRLVDNGVIWKKGNEDEED